jgi:RND family efflux transporter MFP subunit
MKTNWIHGLLFVTMLAVLTAAAGCELRLSATPTTPQGPPPPPQVYYTLPEPQLITDYEDFTGHTEAVKMVQVRSRVSGYLVNVNFEDGADVEKGTVLFEIDNRPFVADLANKEALVVQSQRHVERLKSDFERAQKMVAANPKSISQEQFDQYRFDYIEAQAAQKAATASRDLSEQNVDWAKVTAPISGKLSRRMVDPGNLVVADNTMLTTIVTENPIYGYFDVDEHTLLRLHHLIEQGKIKKDLDSPVSLALSDEEGFPHPGTINFVDNQVDTQTGTIRFRGVFKNSDRMLSPGLFIRARLPIGEPHQALVIPESAINTDQGRKFVWVVNAKNQATYTSIDVGAPFPGERRVVESGLNTGDRVIVSGLQRIARSGLVVAAKELKPSAAPAQKNGEATSR